MNLENEYVPTGVGPSGFIPSSGGEFESASHAEPKIHSQWSLFRRRFFRHKVAIFSIFVLLFLVVVCFGANFFAPYKYTDQDLLLGPVSPNGTYLLGTDELGRDQLSRLLYAGQISLKIGFAVAVISTALGTAVGALAGYYGKATDQLLMRITDLFLIIPAIAILAMALELWGHSDQVIILVLAGLFWMYVARVVRGDVLSLKEKEFVEAARACGCLADADHRAPHHSEHHRADHGERDARCRGGDHRRVDVVVPGLRGAATAGIVGEHARHRRGLRRHEVLVSDLRARDGDPDHRAGGQLHR